MIKEFFQNSKAIIVGANPSNRTGLRKMLTELGCNNRNLQTCVMVEEAVSEIQKSRVNVLVYDDDCKDRSLLLEMLSDFKTRIRDYDNSLLILLSKSVSKEFSPHQNLLHIPKPYTLGTFNEKIELYFKNKELEQKKREKKVKKENVEIKKALSSYNGFKKYIENKIDDVSDDGFIELSQKFIKTLETKIDYESLSQILTIGISSKRYKDLELFVEGWINSIPVKDDFIPDISRVLVYNKKFDLFEKLKTKDAYANLSIGIGMIIAASVISCHDQEKAKALKYIETGIRLAHYKLDVVYKALTCLAEVGAVALAIDIYNEKMVQEQIAQNEDFRERFNEILS